MTANALVDKWLEELISQRVYELIIQISQKYHLALMWNIMIRSCHNFAQATTAELSWYVQNCDMIGSLYAKLGQMECLQDFNYDLISLQWNKSLVIHSIRCSSVQPCVTLAVWWKNFILELVFTNKKILFVHPELKFVTNTVIYPIADGTGQLMNYLPVLVKWILTKFSSKF